jgi:hypothetical protein
MGVPNKYKVALRVTETPFWIVQTSVQAATQTDLMIMLFLTAVTLFSGLRIVAKIAMKLLELLGRCSSRCNNKANIAELEATSLLSDNDSPM